MNIVLLTQAARFVGSRRVFSFHMAAAVARSAQLASTLILPSARMPS